MWKPRIWKGGSIGKARLANNRAGGGSGVPAARAAGDGFCGGQCARSGASLPPLFGVRASLVGPRFLLVVGSVQEVLLLAEI